MKTHRADLICMLLFLLILLSFLPPAIFQASNILASRYSDVITQFLPHQLFIRQSLLEDGTIPLWNPFELSGNPAFPNPLYPLLAFPHALLNFLPPSLALNMGFFMHIFLAGLLTYAYARQVGCAPVASLFAATVFSFGTRSLSHIEAGLYSRAMFFTYIPLLFLCCERCLSWPGLRSSSLLALAMTLALFTGSIQLFIYGTLLVVLYSLIRVWVTPYKMNAVAAPTRSLGWILAGILISAALSAVYLLPSCQLYPLLTRSRPMGFKQYSFMPELSQAGLLLNPKLFGNFSSSAAPPWEFALYTGITPLILIACTPFYKTSRRDLCLWGSIGLATILLSLRGTESIHHLLGSLISPLKAFRNPGRIHYFAPFFTSILAARSLEYLQARKPGWATRSNRWLPLYLFLCGATLLAIAFQWVSLQPIHTIVNNYCTRFTSFFGSSQAALLNMEGVRNEAIAFKHGILQSLLFQIFVLASACLILFLKGRGKLAVWKFGGILLAVALIDLLYFGKPLIEIQSMKTVYPHSELSDQLKRERRYFRLLDASAPFTAAFWTDLSYFQSTAMKISRIDGYSPVNLNSYARYINRMAGVRSDSPVWSIAAPTVKENEMLSLLHTEFILSESPLSHRSLKLVRAFEDVHVYKQFLGTRTIPHLFLYRNTDNFPHAWLIPQGEVSKEGGRLTFARPDAAVIVSHPVAIAVYRPNRIELAVQSERDSYLVMSEIWAPGWTAKDNGVSVRVLRAHEIFRALPVGPGRHRIIMTYMPAGLVQGTTISLLTLACILTVPFVKRVKSWIATSNR
jgi:hypothetical protein